MPNSYTAPGDSDSSNVPQQSWASSSQEVPFAFSKSAPSRPKRPMDQRSPQAPNPAPSKTAHTQLPTLPAVPPLPAAPPAVATAPVVSAPMVKNAMARLTALCRSSGDRPEVLDETLLDARLGTWKVTLKALGRCAVGTGQGKQSAKQHAAEQLLEGSV